MGRKKKQFIKKKDAVTFHVMPGATFDGDEGGDGRRKAPGGAADSGDGPSSEQTLEKQQFELGEYGFPQDGYDYGQHFRVTGSASAVFVPAGKPGASRAASGLPTAEFMPETPVVQWMAPPDRPAASKASRRRGNEPSSDDAVPSVSAPGTGAGGLDEGAVAGGSSIQVVDARALPSAAASILMRREVRHATVLTDVGVEPEPDILEALFDDADEELAAGGGDDGEEGFGDLLDDFVVQANEGVLSGGAAQLSLANVEQFEADGQRRRRRRDNDYDEDDIDSLDGGGRFDSDDEDDLRDHGHGQSDRRTTASRTAAGARPGVPLPYARSEASRTARTQPLQVLDEQFARLMTKEYAGDGFPDDDDLYDGEARHQFDDGDFEQEFIYSDDDDDDDEFNEFSSRARLRAGLREFERDHMTKQTGGLFSDEAGSASGPATPEQRERALLKKRILQSVERAAAEEADAAAGNRKNKRDDAFELVTVDRKDDWDVQSFHAAQSTAISAYQPSEIDDRPPRAFLVDEERRLQLTKNHGMPREGLPTKKTKQRPGSDDDVVDGEAAEAAAAAAAAATMHRDRAETPAERAERKRLVKEHRKARRQEKKHTKQAYAQAKKSKPATTSTTVFKGV